MATRLLLIEDEEQIRENVAELLTLRGYTVETASNGRDGLMQALRVRPDLILCDVMMPQMDGYQVLEAIRTNRSLATVPFVFLTAKADTTDLRRGMSSGADDYLTKPFTSRDLITAIEGRLVQEQRRAADLQARVEKHWQELSSVSVHEYNTPLTGIMGFAHLLTDYYEDFDKAQAQSMLGLIITSCLRLKRTFDNRRLADELLRPDSSVHARLTSGRFRLCGEMLTPILESAAKQYERSLERTTVDIMPAELRMGEEALVKVVAELVDNAFNFSPASSNIQIRGRERDGTYRLTVTNQGRGMSGVEIATIGPYTQFNRDHYEQQGAGLGLFITKRLVELNKGCFSISSQIDGSTTATLDLAAVVEPVV